MNKEYANLKTILDRMLRTKYTGFDTGWVCDRIAWAFKWKKISKEQMNELTDMYFRLKGIIY